MPKRKLPSDEVFTELYKTHTPEEIANMYNCARISVYKKAWHLGLQRGNLPPDDKFKELYFNYTRNELADMYGVAPRTVNDRAKQLGIYNCADHPKGPRRKNIGKEVLEQLLKDYTVKQIAEKYDVSETTVYTWCRTYGLKKNKLFALPPEEFLKLWKKHTEKEIADLYNTSKSAVYRYRQKYNITRQATPRQEKRQKRGHPRKTHLDITEN